MKFAAVFALALLASLPSFGQDQSSCKAFFQVIRARAGSPGLQIGMNSSQMKWWESTGEKKYPGLCLNGSVTTGDKPRYLVVLSKSKSIGSGTVPAGEVYGQTASALQATVPPAWIYQPRWNVASVTIAYVLYDGSIDKPPVYFAPGDRAAWFIPDNQKVLKAAVKYLAQEPVLSPKVR